MALLGSLGKSLYRGATSKYGAGAIIGGAALAGLYKTAARPAADAAMDVAFGDPNADQYFTGGKLSPLMLGGGVVGGVGNLAKFASPQYYEDYAPVGNPMVETGALGAIGATAGALLGKGLKGRALGGVLGGVAGLALGGAAFGKLAANRSNQGLNTPYGGNRRLDPHTLSYTRNTSLDTADQMNSYGDIVFGMHNMRRG